MGLFFDLFLLPKYSDLLLPGERMAKPFFGMAYAAPWMPAVVRIALAVITSRE